MAPFSLWKPPPLIFVDGTVDFFNDKYGIPLKVAASISARFPVVTPPALHSHKVVVGDATIERVLQLVDGGYYENSGVFTAMNLIDRIRSAPISHSASESGKACEANNLIALPRRADQTPISACVKLLIIRELSHLRGEFPTGDLTSAIVAMYKVRFAKAVANLGLAGQLYCGGVYCGLGKWAVRPHVYGAYIDVQKLGLPLGWYFSDKAMSKVFETDPAALECPIANDISEARPANSAEAARQEESACLRSRISQDLLPPGGG